MNPSDERRNRRISLPLSTTRLAVVALVLTAIGMPVAWASAGFPSSSAQVVLAPTPVFLNETQNPGPFDLDSPPVLCQTASYTPTNDSTARMDSWVTLAGGPFAWLVRNVISANGGNTWQDADSVASVGASHGLSEGDIDQGTAGNSAIVHLAPGVPYRFGVRASRGNGEADAPAGGACEVLVEITQDPGSPGPPGPPGTEPGGPVPGPLP